VLTARDAEGAISVLREQAVHLLIADKNLPGMGGVELVALACRERPGLEAMVITGHASAESVLAAMAAGASDYLLKPFEDLVVVRAKVRAALERRVVYQGSRQRARRLAREASTLLAGGGEVADEAWSELGARLAAYEAAIREAGGKVLVVGPAELARAIAAEGFQVAGASPGEAAAAPPGVVVLDTARPDWREAATWLGESHDVVLVGGPTTELDDLIEALALRMDLVPFAASRPGALPARIRTLLVRRAVEHAQVGLEKALEAFRAAVQRG